MTTRLWVKLIVVLALLLLMVMVGLSYDQNVNFRLKPLGIQGGKLPLAIMFFIFFGAGVVTGAILVVGPGKGGKGN